MIKIIYSYNHKRNEYYSITYIKLDVQEHFPLIIELIGALDGVTLCMIVKEYRYTITIDVDAFYQDFYHGLEENFEEYGNYDTYISDDHPFISRTVRNMIRSPK